MRVRHTIPSDHARIISVMEEWWGGRDLTSMVPKLFLVHFCNTSFVVEKDDELVAFFIGFLSPNRQAEGYIHFVGVNPDYRGTGVGGHLYGRFFQLCRENNRHIVRACTSPVNKGSIVFHTKMGFEIEQGNATVDGVQVTLDYNKPNDPKVLFKKSLSGA
ncbi:MAG: GNAT family N-acetyltransferase [Chloroflexota bacterium]